MMNKKGFVVPGIIIGLLLIGVFIYAYENNFLGTADITGGNSGYFEAPYIPYLQCQQAGTAKPYDDGKGNIVADSGDWISDNFPSNTNGWNIMLILPTGAFGGSKVDYYICPQRNYAQGNCQHLTFTQSQGSQANLGLISSDSFIYAKFSRLNLPGSLQGQYSLTYQPYILNRIDLLRGSGQVLESNGCEVPDSYWNNRLLSSFEGKPPATTRALQVNDIFNYFSGTITRAAAGNLESNGKYCIYSNGVATLYNVIPLVTSAGSYKTIDTTKPAGNQQCCGSDSLPGKTCINGQWKDVSQASCQANTCQTPDFVPDLSASHQAIKYCCTNGQYQAFTKQVECTKDSDCATNSRCNLNTFTCAIASNIGGAGEIRIATNDQDCQKQGGKWIKSTTQQDSLASTLLPFWFKPKIIVNEYCDFGTPWWQTLLWIIGIVVVGFLLIRLLPALIPSLRGVLHAIPYLGRLIP